MKTLGAFMIVCGAIAGATVSGALRPPAVGMWAVLAATVLFAGAYLVWEALQERRPPLWLALDDEARTRAGNGPLTRAGRARHPDYLQLISLRATQLNGGCDGDDAAYRAHFLECCVGEVEGAEVG